MAAAIWKAATSNAFSTTLNGSISSSDATITLTSVTGLQFPGVLVLDRQDGNGTNTPLIREYISYTGISGNQLTGCTRGVAGSSAQAHSSGALVEETFTVTHWGNFLESYLTEHTSTGGHVISTATINTARVLTHLNVSGASITGNFPIHPTWVIGGYVSLATTSVGKPAPLPNSGIWKFFSAVLRAPVSGASLVLDINLNGTSIFTDQNTRLSILGGGTYVSTASIGTLGFTAGGILTVDIDNGGGLAQDLTVMGKGA